jgi:spore coat polysaccharide biosynthesis protein SpsF
MILAILQARTSSTRLPGKVLLDVLGKPMIIRQIERIKYAKNMKCCLILFNTE